MGQELIMTRSILLDTDILVDFFRGHVKAVAFMNNYSDRIILSSIVVAELFAGAKGSAEQVALEEFVSLFRVVPVNVEIAKLKFDSLSRFLVVRAAGSRINTGGRFFRSPKGSATEII
jgi:predicted nucleic acid-binding protein